MNHPKLLLLALAVLAAGASAQAEPEGDWSHHRGKVPFVVGYEAGLAEAAKQDKPVMLFFTATWCGPCKQLAAESFADEQIADVLKAFVPIIVDGDVEQEVLESFKVERYPDIRFQTLDGIELARVSGYVPKARFLETAESAVKRLDEASPPPAPVFAEAGLAKGLKVGASIPAVTVKTLEGKPFDLRAAALAKPTVLIFYRGGWCPFCTRHLAELRTIEADLVGLGYQLLAISPDLPEDATKTTKEEELGYTLLSDPGLAAARRFQLAFRLDPETIVKYRGYGFDLSEQDWSLPVPAAFVIDTAGKVVFAHVDPDYKSRVRAADLMDAARQALATPHQADKDQADKDQAHQDHP